MTLERSSCTGTGTCPTSPKFLLRRFYGREWKCPDCGSRWTADFHAGLYGGIFKMVKVP